MQYNHKAKNVLEAFGLTREEFEATKQKVEKIVNDLTMKGRPLSELVEESLKLEEKELAVLLSALFRQMIDGATK